jgi:hypothetical protein
MELADEINQILLGEVTEAAKYRMVAQSLTVDGERKDRIINELKVKCR